MPAWMLSILLRTCWSVNYCRVARSVRPAYSSTQQSVSLSGTRDTSTTRTRIQSHHMSATAHVTWTWCHALQSVLCSQQHSTVRLVNIRPSDQSESSIGRHQNSSRRDGSRKTPTLSILPSLVHPSLYSAIYRHQPVLVFQVCMTSFWWSKFLFA